MKTWRTKLLGDNHINFYGWCVAGLFVMGGSAWYVLKALRAGTSSTPEGLILIAIYFVLLGQFGIGVHNYTARVAEKLDSEGETKVDEHVV